MDRTEAWPRGATPRPRSGAVTKSARLRLHKRAERSYPTFKVRRGSPDKTTLLQGKEQQLRFAGAAVKRDPHVQGKRNPSNTVGVARGHQRADTMKP